MPEQALDINNVIVSDLQIAATIATDTTTNGAAYLLPAKHRLMVVAEASAYTDGAYAVTVESSPDGSTSWDTVTIYDGSLPSIGAAGTQIKASYRPVEADQYYRVSIASTSTTSGATLAAYFIAVPGRV